MVAFIYGLQDIYLIDQKRNKNSLLLSWVIHGKSCYGSWLYYYSLCCYMNSHELPTNCFMDNSCCLVVLLFGGLVVWLFCCQSRCRRILHTTKQLNHKTTKQLTNQPNLTNYESPSPSVLQVRWCSPVRYGLHD